MTRINSRTEAIWMEEYMQKEALWVHDGNPKRPHSLLTSGLHSNGFFNSKPVIAENEELRAEAVLDLWGFLFTEEIVDEIDRVVGPQTGATKLAEDLAEMVGGSNRQPCEWASPEKIGDGPDKKMVFTDDKRKVLPGEFVLLVEDVLTTGGSVALTKNAVVECGGIILPYLLVVVNRSGLAEVDGKKIVSLIDRHMPTWTAEECQKSQLCSVGSEAIRPKQGNNWARLNAVY